MGVRTKLRRSGVLAGALSVLSLLGVGTTRAQQAPIVRSPVVGGDDGAYQGTVPPAPRTGAQLSTFFFSGTPADQATKVAFMPTATFSPDKPTGPATITQQSGAGSVANIELAGNPLNISWFGRAAGTFDGAVEFRWYWSVAQPNLVSTPAEVVIFADLDEPGLGRILGRTKVDLSVGLQPVFNLTRVPIQGTSARSLVVQVGGSIEGLTVSYGSTTYPSSFGLPVATEEPVPIASRPVRSDRQKLVVQAADLPRPAGEPTIGVTKDGSAYITTVDFDVNGVVFRTGNATKVLKSADGGVTWASVQPAYPGNLNEPVTTLDPYVYVDESTGRVFNLELYGVCSYLLFSDDGGRSWTRNPLACGPFVNDHQTLVAGPPPANLRTTGYPNVLYYCVNRVVNADCSRSLDGGRTFAALPNPAFFGYDQAAGGLCGGLHGHARTDAAGRLFLPKGHCNSPWIAVSDDGGDSWRRVRVSSTVSSANPHTSLAVDEAGNIFYLWTGPDTLPYLSVSSDHGSTWSEPRMVAPPGVRQVFVPTIAAGAEGRVAMIMPATKQDAPPAGGDFRPWNYYLSVSDDALASDPTFLYASGNPVDDPIHRGRCPASAKCAAMLDFLNVVVAPSGEAWGAAVDTCTKEEGCIENNGPTVPEGGLAPSAVGVAVRQLCGPALRGPKGDAGERCGLSAFSATGPRSSVAGQPAGLPPTGGRPWLAPALAALVMAAALRLVSGRRPAPAPAAAPAPGLSLRPPRRPPRP